MIRRATLSDAPAMMEIYNHHVLHGTATYQEEPETLAHRERWLLSHDNAHPAFVIENEAGKVVGWSSLSPFHPRSAYRFTVENSIYLHHEQTGRGLGSQLLEHLIQVAAEAGHRQIVALISSDQPASIRLHEKFGFHKAGHLRDVGLKFGRWLSLDLWQLSLEPK